MDFVTHGDLARLSSSRGAATSRLTPPECPATFTKPLSVRGPRVGLLGRVRASRARAQNTAPAFARFARETEPGAALRLEGAERKSLSSAGRQSHEDHVATTLTASTCVP